MKTHEEAFKAVMGILTDNDDLSPDAVGHRVVHGSDCFSKPAVITEKVYKQLESIQHLAPLHNPPAMKLIAACTENYPHLPQVAIFDTAYHATIPDFAYTYALPVSLAKKMQIRKYGFHGTSHQFVVEETAKFIKKDIESFNAVSCHLGSGGASLCAVINGKSVDNTMGFSPLQGLVMSTRSGDIDPAIVMNFLFYKNSGIDDIEKILNKQSGILGLSGISSDIRDVLSGLEKQASPELLKRLQNAADIYLWRIRKYLGSYLAVVPNADAIIFTDTIGESVPFVRWSVCNDMNIFGIIPDPEKNEKLKTLPFDFATAESRVRLVVIATNEELAIAGQTYRLLSKKNNVKNPD